ncbi:MAG TPA: 7TM diverse intracellular signaling domain-containing protein [Leptospiraceae bacterium]|nr:7TM diverse intracellular signaling domain-containing protein [Leptospiraceae bacterium]HMW04113.1 7TM diverse intracellular signaling domain-containing protein [Leptospiraceae bacterium]HMX30820.1 7TM diverse intracellular signaling domain-containing protein [Leptospiraceae bacterium]HMY30106.1 7TM diverse intracellular signaling domain-containing protein [Leptospiraceae bacterium]HMZ65456.1 7TM diverse intracellular signaling domain-containing protein [Leptospiraceae bacterium]
MKYFLNIKFVLLILLFFLGNCYAPSEDLITEVLDLSESEWHVDFEDNAEYASPEFSHQSWQAVEVPGNLRLLDSSHRGVFWMRKSFELDAENFTSALALTLGKIYDRDEVYLNGKIIGINGKSPDDIQQNEVAYGRLRIYTIPAGLIRKGTNVVAIKINSNFRAYAGIVSGPVGISTLESASSYLIQHAVDDVIFAAVYLFIGVFFIISFTKMKEMKEYLAFSIFIISFSILHFVRNEFRFEFANNFLVFKYIESALILNMPFFYIQFFQSFFKLSKIKYQNYYFLLNLGLSIVFLAIPNYVFWNNFINIWVINIILILGYSLYVSIQKAKEKDRDAIIYSIALVYFIYSVLKEIFLERGYIQGQSSIEASVLFYILLVTIALRLRFIVLKIKIQNRFEQLKEIDQLREKIFLYMDRILSPSIDESILMTRALKNNNNPEAVAETIPKIQVIYSEMQNSLDDILELSRLEVMSEPLSKETVDFVDFIRTILAMADVTYTIKVDDKFQIHNSLDLINSLIIRLIDFTGFKDISSIDLIVTSDLKNHLHFRFMLYSVDHKKTQKLYKQLNDFTVGGNINSVRWAIINEILRLLDGHLEMRLINKKYVRIDFELQALPLEEEKVSKPKFDFKIPKLKFNIKLPTFKK